MTTLENHNHLMSIRDALPYIPLRPYTFSDQEKLPHTILTPDKYWDPMVVDCEGQVDNETWFDA